MFLGSCVGCLPASATSLSYWTTLSPHHYLPPTELNAMSSYGVKNPTSFHIAEILHHHQHQQHQQQQQHLQQQHQQQQLQQNTTHDNSNISSNSSDISKVVSCNNNITSKYISCRTSSPCGHAHSTIDAPTLSRTVVDIGEDDGTVAIEKGGGRGERERGEGEENHAVALTVTSSSSSSSASSSSSLSSLSSSSTTGVVGSGCREEEGFSMKREQSAMVRSVGSLLTASAAESGILSNSSRSYSPTIDATSLSTTVAGGIAPLQALCSAGAFSRLSSSGVINNSNGIDLSQNLSVYRGRSGPSGATASASQLKFGINRILSEDFGKHRLDKENLRVTPSSRAFHLALSTHHPHHHQHHHQQTTDTHSCHSLCACHTSAMAAAVAVGPQYSAAVYSSLHYPAHALSAVHAIQPPQYPITTSTDGLPGPYSILNTDQHSASQPKRKRSWSRAVFSNLQRKGLEKRFEVQKYVTKPDRRQLAAMLGLTDAQVKVWFQNRRMKWRHSQQQKDQKSENDRNENLTENGKEKSELADSSKEIDYDSKDSSDSSDNEEMDVENDMESQRTIPISVTMTMPQLKCEKID